MPKAKIWKISQRGSGRSYAGIHRAYKGTVHQAVTHTQRISADGRRLYTSSRIIDVPLDEQDVLEGPAEPYTEGAGDLDQALDVADPTEEDINEDDTFCDETHTSKEYKTVTHDPILLAWTSQRDMFLQEMLRLEGLCGSEIDHCLGCSRASVAATYRCLDCIGGDSKLRCKECCINEHVRRPFHRIKVWNGSYFEHTTLREIGLYVQLGHPHGERCAAPSAADTRLMVLDTNGIHSVDLWFCTCDRMHLAGTIIQQLLRAELFPASLDSPTTCCTMRLLQTFHIMTLQSKVNAYDYYLSLEKMTNNTGLLGGFDRFKQFLRMIRQWRHLKMLKRAGRGHEKGGVMATPTGALAVMCPACPRPGVNLPDDWRTIDPDRRYIYKRFTAEDASFRHKRRAISNETRDPALGSGLGYFVNDPPYRVWLARFVKQDEISSCTGLAALKKADTRWLKGYAATGIGMVCCARHGFVCANGVGDLQKGERYCNMDYIYCAQARLTSDELEQTSSYDIACMWAIYLAQRIKELPPDVTIDLTRRQISHVIPKYHMRAHKEAGHNRFSLNLVPGVGRTDGEEIERTWSRHDATAGSTREMGPGSRHDTLEDHFGWSNWQKLIGLGKLLKRRLRDARRGYKHQAKHHKRYTSKIDAENLLRWTEQVVAWEKDMDKPDPYFIAPSGMTQAQIRLQLAEEDDKHISEGALSLHEVTPAGMIMLLLDIEEQQCRFRSVHPPSDKVPPSQAAKVVEARGRLRRRIAQASVIQAVYMPGVPALVARLNQERRRKGEEDEVAERQKLFLPSEVDRDVLDTWGGNLAAIESRLREGQLRDSMDKLRNQLHVKSQLVRDKRVDGRGQKHNTRSNTRIQTNERKIREHTNAYRNAWAAKKRLCGDGLWEQEWRFLNFEDVRGAQDDEIDVTTGVPVSEGKRQMSWIWMSAGQGSNSSSGEIPGMHDVQRVQWLKSRARTLRFEEEVAILVEEQRRVVASLQYSAMEWDARKEVCSSGDMHAHGAAAYAAEQAALLRSIAARFQDMWHNEDDEDEESDGLADVEENQVDSEYVDTLSDKEVDDADEDRFSYCSDTEDIW